MYIDNICIMGATAHVFIYLSFMISSFISLYDINRHC